MVLVREIKILLLESRCHNPGVLFNDILNCCWKPRNFTLIDNVPLSVFELRCAQKFTVVNREIQHILGNLTVLVEEFQLK